VRRPLAEFLDPLLALTLLLAFAGATPFARRIGEWREQRAARGGVLGSMVLCADVVWLLFVGVAACGWLAAGTYNPFIYFRF
jgi:alginate O-acetyltransferase complex protein AlgI